MTKHVPNRLLLLVVLASLLVSLCACGGDTANDGTQTPAPSSSGSEPGSQSPEQTGTAATNEPSTGSSVTVGISQELDSLDPHKAVSAGSSEVLFNVFEGLMKPSPDGEVVPALASDYKISEDGLTYTFTLREGVTFHNGEPVTVKDVLYSLERCAGSENEGTPLISAFSAVSAFEAPDETHVTVTLESPSLEFIYSMTAAIIPEGSGEEMAANPVGTGPFQYVSYTPLESLVVKKYDGYWGEPAYLDQVTFRIFQSGDTMVMSLKSGGVDMAVHVPNTQAGELTDFTIEADTMKLVQALYLNNQEKPFDDVRVRQALCYAVNVQEIIDLVCDGHGVATGSSMYPAFSRYFMPELADAYPTDVSKAKQLLADAGYPDGFKMDITVPSNYPQHVQTAEVIAEQLKAIGVTASIVPVDWDTWVTKVYRGREFQSTVCGIAASDMTAREMLLRYCSDNKKDFINFADEEYDQMVAEAMTTLDNDEQTRAYKRAEEILSEQAASVWLQDLCDLAVLKPGLEGMTFYRTYVLDMSCIKQVG